MAEKIGQLIKRIAEGRGFSQKEFGESINLTKQGAASIYRRATIDTELLKLISEKLDYDFFAHFYAEPPLLKYKQTEKENWEAQLNQLRQQIVSMEKLLESKDEILALQRKYIAELEGKLRKQV